MEERKEELQFTSSTPDATITQTTPQNQQVPQNSQTQPKQQTPLSTHPISNSQPPVLQQKSVQTSTIQPSPQKTHSTNTPTTHDDKPRWHTHVRNFLTECRRVLRSTKKPDLTELKTIIKVSGIGILVIGTIGFAIAMSRELLMPLFSYIKEFMA